MALHPSTPTLTGSRVTQWSFACPRTYCLWVLSPPQPVLGPFWARLERTLDLKLITMTGGRKLQIPVQMNRWHSGQSARLLSWQSGFKSRSFHFFFLLLSAFSDVFGHVAARWRLLDHVVLLSGVVHFWVTSPDLGGLGYVMNNKALVLGSTAIHCSPPGWTPDPGWLGRLLRAGHQASGFTTCGSVRSFCDR